MMIEALKTISPLEFCDDFLKFSWLLMTTQSQELFTYIHWLAAQVQEQQAEIAELHVTVENLSTADEYDKLLKEKSSWSSSMRQLQNELDEEKMAREKAEGERDEARNANAILIQQHQLALTSAKQELGAL